MHVFVNNFNILTALSLYNIAQSLIRKSVSLFEIMNAQSYTINCLIWNFSIYACMQIVALCGFIILNNDIDFVINFDVSNINEELYINLDCIQIYSYINACNG